MRKIWNFLIILIIFIVSYYIFYKISYPIIQEYIFPFRFEDDWDAYLNSVISSFTLSIILSSISTYFLRKRI
jgi:hypothetical protein